MKQLRSAIVSETEADPMTTIMIDSVLKEAVCDIMFFFSLSVLPLSVPVTPNRIENNCFFCTILNYDNFFKKKSLPIFQVCEILQDEVIIGIINDAVRTKMKTLSRKL